MPKSQLDWFGVACLWIGGLVMAIKAGDLDLIPGAPQFLAANFWGYIPFALITLYLAIALYRALPQRAPKPQSDTKASMNLVPMSLIENREDARVIDQLERAKRGADMALSSRSRREFQKEVPTMKAALLSANKRFGISQPPASELDDVDLITGSRLIEAIIPFLKAGHVKEAQSEAQNFIAKIKTG